MANGCEGAMASCAAICSPSSIIPRLAPTTTAQSASCAQPRPIARSPAASAPNGAPTSSPPSALSSAPPHDAVSTPIRPSDWSYRASPCSLQPDPDPGEMSRYFHTVWSGLDLSDNAGPDSSPDRGRRAQNCVDGTNADLAAARCRQVPQPRSGAPKAPDLTAARLAAAH